MRKPATSNPKATHFTERLAVGVLLLATALTPSPSHAQTAAPAAEAASDVSVKPDNLAAALSDAPKLVAALNEARSHFGLNLRSSPAFHLKAHVDLFDTHGKPAGTSTFEQYWDGKQRGQTSIDYGGSTETRWKSPTVFTLGEAPENSYFLNRLLAEFSNPIPSPEPDKHSFEDRPFCGLCSSWASFGGRGRVLAK